MVVIKRLRARDIAVLDRVADNVFDAPIQADRVAMFLADHCHLLVVALYGSEVVGQARAIIHLSPDQPTELYINNSGVTPRFKWQGIGGRMLDELLVWGQERGCEYVSLGTELRNVEAKAFKRAEAPRQRAA